MQSFLGYMVRAGDLMSAKAWNSAMQAVRALRLVSGYGVRLRQMPDGTIVNLDIPKTVFNHPWKVSYAGGTSVKILPGRVNKVMTYFVSDAGDPIPMDDPTVDFIDFKKWNLDEKGYGWLAVEVAASIKDWSMVEGANKIVQVANLYTDDGKVPAAGTAVEPALSGAPNLKGRRARHPIAVIRQQASSGTTIRQVTFHDLAHTVKTSGPDPKADVGRHFFYPEG